MDNHKKERDFYIQSWESFGAKESKIQFTYEPKEFVVADYDWYIIVALEKVDKVTVNREQLTSSLLMAYRWAIREGYNHQLDRNLQNRYDYPRNRNTIEGIKNYIKLIERKSKENES